MKIKFVTYLLIAFFIFFSCATPNMMLKSSYPEEKLNWHLGAQAYTFNRFTFEEALGKIKECNLRYVEAYPQQVISGKVKEKLNYNMSKEAKDYVKKLLAENGVQLEVYGVIKAEDEIEWEKVFSFAKSMGIKTISCEPKAEMLDVVSKLADKYEINVALHNHPTPSYYWDPEVVKKSLEGRSKRMGAAADIGHWVRSGLDPVACLKQLEGRVYHLHFKDLNESNNKKAHDVHWGTGVNNIAGVIEELKRQKYKGMISAEYEYNWINNVPDVKQSVINFRELLK